MDKIRSVTVRLSSGDDGGSQYCVCGAGGAGGGRNSVHDWTILFIHLCVHVWHINQDPAVGNVFGLTHTHSQRRRIKHRHTRTQIPCVCVCAPVGLWHAPGRLPAKHGPAADNIDPYT